MAQDNTLAFVAIAALGYFLYTKHYGQSPLAPAAPQAPSAAQAVGCVPSDFVGPLLPGQTYC